MTKQEVSERFSGGHVKHMVTTHKGRTVARTDSRHCNLCCPH